MKLGDRLACGPPGGRVHGQDGCLACPRGAAWLLHVWVACGRRREAEPAQGCPAASLATLLTAPCSWPTGFVIYFGYGLWHSEEASLATGQARTPDGNLDHCK